MEILARTGYTQYFPSQHKMWYYLRFVVESLDSITGRNMTFKNEKTEATEEKNGSLAESYRVPCCATFAFMWPWK